MIKIAIVQTAFSGDVILSLPIYQALKELDSSNYLAAVIRPESIPLLTNNPYVDEIIPFDKYGADKGFSGIAATTSKLRGFDKAILVQRHLRSALIAVLARIPERIGYNISAAHFFYTTKVIYRDNVHEVQRCLDLIGVINEQKKYQPEIYLDQKICDNAVKLLECNGIKNNFIAIAPGSVWFTKRYVHFPELVDLLCDQFKMPVVLLGSLADSELCNKIAKSCAHPPVDLSGKTDLLLSAAIICRASLAITNDSAPSHIAAAVGTPIIAIFGPTVPAFGFAPYSDNSTVVELDGLYCRPCSRHGLDRCPQGHFRCMKELAPEKIIAAAKLLLAGAI